MTDLDTKFPSVDHLRERAMRRMPHFAFEYLDSGTGTEIGLDRNRKALDDVLFMPEVLHGPIDADLTSQFMGKKYSLPIGIAPVGMSGLMWPGAERRLAKASVDNTIPYCLSTVSSVLPEEISPFLGEMGWFQLYLPASGEVRRDILRRASDAGFDKLVVTVDVPGESRRERQRKARMGYPPKLDLWILLAMLMRPRWCLEMAREGRPRMKLAESYLEPGQRASNAFVHAGRVIRGFPDWQTMERIRDEWDRDILVKGILRPEDAIRLVEMGMDGIWVSNHSARQFDGGPASIKQLPLIREALGKKIPVLFDSGVMGGLDVMRALALGADMVFLGRAFHYAVGALSDRGIQHLIKVLEADMKANMSQIGARRLDDLSSRLVGLPLELARESVQSEQ